jgi:hypothetical protein
MSIDPNLLVEFVEFAIYSRWSISTGEQAR